MIIDNPQTTNTNSAAQAISAQLTAMCFLTRKRQAPLVGEAASHWSDYLNGKKQPGIQKVMDWIDHASKETGRPIRLTYFEGEWSAG